MLSFVTLPLCKAVRLDGVTASTHVLRETFSEFVMCERAGFSRLADQMRLMTFPQWFELLQSVFENFILFLKRIKVHLHFI